MYLPDVLDRDPGTKLVVAGCALGTLSLVLPYAALSEPRSSIPGGVGSLGGVSWQWGKLFLFLLVVTLVATYLLTRPRIRAAVAGVSGTAGLLLPVLITRRVAVTPAGVSGYRPGIGVWVAGMAGALILLGALYWWVRPDRSYPHTDPLPRKQSE